MPVDWGFVGVILAVVFGIATVVGIVYAIRSYNRDHPKRRLEYTVRRTALVQTTFSADLEIRIKGVRIEDPHLVELSLRSNSRADIPSDRFNGGESLVFRVEPGGAMVSRAGPYGQGFTMNVGGGTGWDWAEFVLPPQLIRKDANLSFTFISNGAPGVTVRSPLIDIDVLDVSKRPHAVDFTMSVIVAIVWLVSSVGLITIFVLFGGTMMWWGWLTFAITIPLFGFLVAKDLRAKFGWRRSA